MDGRSKNGGARPYSGRKTKAEWFGLAALLEECWTLDERKECLNVLSARARAGDIRAIELLLAYAYGKPATPYFDLAGKTPEEIVSRVVELSGAVR